MGLITIGLFNMCKSDGYKVIDSVTEGKISITKRVILPNVVSADSVIEITRELKQKDGDTENFVCYFYQPGMDLNICWVAVSYLSDTSKCNKKDKDGVSLKFDEVLPGFVSNETLMKLKSKNFDRKDLIKEVSDPIANVKYEIYRKGNGSEAILVTLRPDGSTKVIPLKIKIENGTTKYLFNNPKIPGFLVLEEKYMMIYDSEDMKNGRSLPY